MWPVSSRFIDAVVNGGTWAVHAEVQQFGVVVPGGEEIPLTSGQVSCDSTAAIRRRIGQLQIGGDQDGSGLSNWMVDVPSDLLFPGGREIFVSAGFEYSDGSSELVPQGIFRISNTKTQNVRDLAGVQLDAYDRSRAISRARFTQPYIVPAGTSYPDAIKALILRAFPWFDDDMFLFMDSNFATVQLIFAQEADPWASALQMASAMGADLFFDGLGRPVLQPLSDPTEATSVWDYTYDEEATVEEVYRDFDDENTYNGVIVTGQNSNSAIPPIHAEAWDTDPDSPTYYDPAFPELSSYGPVPYFITSDLITTLAQGQAAADGNLTKVKGVLEAVTFAAIPNPAHQEADVITLTDPNVKLSGQVNVLDSFSFDLGLGQLLQGTSRKVRVG